MVDAAAGPPDVVAVTGAWRPTTAAGRVMVLAAVLVAVQAMVFFGLRAGETRVLFDAAEIAPSLEIYGDKALSQTFIARADGLTAITLYPQPRQRPTTGTVELTLEVDPQMLIAHTSVAAADFIGRPEWTWTFPPVAASARQRFLLRVGVRDATEGSGLSLAIGPPTYADGALAVGGRAQWGDLRFQTRSQYSRVVDLLRRRPGVRHGVWVSVAACAVMILLATSLSALTLGLIQDRAGE
jgi:hypothetical protein